jgi:CheY-like chemotaxis protein
MVRGYVTQSGGEVDLRSIPGEGTTVEIRVPEIEHPGPSGGREPGPTGGGETILLIDDEPVVAEFELRALARLGYRVVVADSGAAAIEAARAESGPIDLILSDVIMPGLSGPETVAAIRKGHPEAAVLFVSGYTADAVTEQGVIPEGVDLIKKPFSIETLANRVRDLVAARSAAPDERPATRG